MIIDIFFRSSGVGGGLKPIKSTPSSEKLSFRKTSCLGGNGGGLQQKPGLSGVPRIKSIGSS